MKQKLKEIADVRTGYQFRGKVLASDDANVSVIQIKDVDEHLFVHTADLVPVKVDNPEPYLVSQYDVLFLSRGHRQYAAIVNQPVQHTIATGYFFILRPRASLIRPGFLAWTLNQPEFQEAIRPFVRGSHIPLVSKSDFLNTSIQVPPLVVQDRIMAFQTLFEREKQLCAAILQKRYLLVQAVSDKLITSQLTVSGKRP